MHFCTYIVYERTSTYIHITIIGMVCHHKDAFGKAIIEDVIQKLTFLLAIINRITADKTFDYVYDRYM